MKSLIRTLIYCQCVLGWLLLITFVQGTALGQLQLTTPTSRIVYQRNNANAATIPLMGHCPANATLVEARMVARQGGASSDWVTVHASPNNGILKENSHRFRAAGITSTCGPGLVKRFWKVPRWKG